MEKLNIIGSPIREPQNNKPRIFANVTGELSKKTLPSLAPRDYKGMPSNGLSVSYTRVRTHRHFLHTSPESTL